MTDVTPRLKDDSYNFCDCGHERCVDAEGQPLYGRLRKVRPDGTRHVYDCRCPSCNGRRSRNKGDRKALRARKALNIGGVNSRHEELFGGALRVEIKAGGQIAPAVTAYEKCRGQSEAARPIGDNRPFAAVWMPDGSKDGVMAFRLSDAYDVAVAILENRVGP